MVAEVPPPPAASHAASLLEVPMTHDRDAFEDISALVREGRLQEARERIEAALLDWPEDFWLLRQLAGVLLRQGDTWRTGPLIANLMARRPDHPRVLALAAERHRLEGRLEDAATGFLASLAGQDDPYVRSRAVDTLLALKRYTEAEPLILEGLRQHPQDAFLLRRQARLLAATARSAEAMAVLSLTARDAAHPRDYVEALKLRLQPLAIEEQRQEVERLLKVGSHQDNPWLHALAGDLRLTLGAKDAARASFDRAEALAAGDPMLLKHLGFQLNRLEAPVRVLDTLGPAFVHDPRDITAQQLLLSAARKAGELARARTIFTLAYQKHPGFHKLIGLIRKVEKEMAERAVHLAGAPLPDTPLEAVTPPPAPHRAQDSAEPTLLDVRPRGFRQDPPPPRQKASRGKRSGKPPGQAAAGEPDPATPGIARPRSRKKEADTSSTKRVTPSSTRATETGVPPTAAPDPAAGQPCPALPAPEASGAAISPVPQSPRRSRPSRTAGSPALPGPSSSPRPARQAPGPRPSPLEAPAAPDAGLASPENPALSPHDAQNQELP